MEKYWLITRAIESIAFISMIARAIVRSISICTICILIASAHVHCAFVHIFEKIDLIYIVIKLFLKTLYQKLLFLILFFILDDGKILIDYRCNWIHRLHIHDCKNNCKILLYLYSLHSHHICSYSLCIR